MNELTRTHIEKKNTRKMVYESIYKQCCEKIRYMNKQWHKTSCSFIVPSIQIGLPIYKMETCIVYLMHQLKKKGFYLEFLFPNKLNISWEQALIRELKDNDTEWHNITGGKLYGNGSGGESRDNIDNIDYSNHAPLSQIVSQTNPSLGNEALRWDQQILNQQPNNSIKELENIRSNQQSQYQQCPPTIDKISSAPMFSSSFTNLPAPVSTQTHSRRNYVPPPIVVSGGGDSKEDEQRQRERARKRRTKRQNEERYKNEQERIAEVIRKKNNDAMRALNFSTAQKDDKPHKKVLQIKP